MADKNTQQNTGNMHTSEVLLRPRLTEKAVALMEQGVYTFDVSPRANKTMVAKAIESVYKVKPVKVSVSNIKTKTKRNPRTGKLGTTTGGKKAFVYLKKGDSISIM